MFSRFYGVTYQFWKACDSHLLVFFFIGVFPQKQFFLYHFCVYSFCFLLYWLILPKQTSSQHTFMSFALFKEYRQCQAECIFCYCLNKFIHEPWKSEGIIWSSDAVFVLLTVNWSFPLAGLARWPSYACIYSGRHRHKWLK